MRPTPQLGVGDTGEGPARRRRPERNLTTALLLHFPRELEDKRYWDDEGDAPDETTRLSSRALNEALPEGVRIRFQDQWDYLDDLHGPSPIWVPSPPSDSDSESDSD